MPAHYLSTAFGERCIWLHSEHRFQTVYSRRDEDRETAMQPHQMPTLFRKLGLRERHAERPTLGSHVLLRVGRVFLVHNEFRTMGTDRTKNPCGTPFVEKQFAFV